jgi:adenine deaminase
MRLGMHIFIREATGAHNLQGLLGLFAPEFASRICLCTDDRHPADLLDQGSVDYIIRSAVEQGVPAVSAIRAATLNPAQYFRLNDLGAIAPGRKADFVLFSSLDNIKAEQVYRSGRLVAANGQALPWEQPYKHTKARGTINIRWERLNLSIPAESDKIKIIGLIPNQITTQALEETAPVRDGFVVPDPGRDIAKLAVIERHFGTGNVGLGLLKGLGLQRGALASTVAHDHHNLVVAGVDDESILLAAHTIAEMQGGMVAVADGKVLAKLALPIAGLMSDKPIEAVRQNHDDLVHAAQELGSRLHDPYMTLAFMALSVIPSLKLTDMGLVDVEKFELTNLFI